MALGVDQQVSDQRADYVVPFETERGGILSLATLSGIQYAVYEANPTRDTIPLGLQQYDFEEVDLFRAIAPWSTRRAYPAFSRAPYITLGIVVTNAIHPHVDASTIRPGAPVYLAPSGLITSNTTFSNRRIGTFDSALNDPTIRVSANSIGVSSMRVAGNQAIVDPQPATIPTAGWARVRIHIR